MSEPAVPVRSHDAARLGPNAGRVAAFCGTGWLSKTVRAIPVAYQPDSLKSDLLCWFYDGRSRMWAV